MSNEPITLAYDLEGRKVGCVLIQAALGCRSDLCDMWPVECWEMGDPSKLRLMRATMDQWKTLAAKDAARGAKKSHP